MSFLFGAEAPAPAPMPVSPVSDDAKIAEREAAARDAQLQRAQAGRRSTIVGGMALAEDEQYQRGMASKTRRGAMSSEVLGG